MHLAKPIDPGRTGGLGRDARDEVAAAPLSRSVARAIDSVGPEPENAPMWGRARHAGVTRPRWSCWCGVRHVLAAGPASGTARAGFPPGLLPPTSTARFVRCCPIAASVATGPTPSKRKAKLRLDTRDGLFKDLRGGDGRRHAGGPGAQRDDSPNPVAGRRRRPDATRGRAPGPTATEKDLLTRWVSEGAPYRAHWSWEPVASPAVPMQTGRRTPIDAFVRERLDAEGMAPSPPAGPKCCCGVSRSTSRACRRAGRNRRLSRRPFASRLRTASSIAARLAGVWRADGRRLARPRAVCRHLRLPVRLSTATCRRIATGSSVRSTATCRTTSSSPGSSPATCCPSATREQRIATAFNRLHRQTNEGGSIEEEFRTEYVADRVNTFGTALLGPDARMRALPRSQVRSDHAARLLLAVRVLQQHRRIRAVLALHERHAAPTLMLWPAEQAAQHRQLQSADCGVRSTASASWTRAEPAFAVWRKTARR